MQTASFLIASCVCVAFVVSVASGQPVPTQEPTKILKWKDGNKAAFYLAFDDACPTHLTNVIPELLKRKIVGTFYVIADSGNFKDKPAWKEHAKSPYVVLANHTFTHKGAPTVEAFEQEVVKANEVLDQYVPNAKPGALRSFGTPGGVKWGITEAQRKEVLAKHNLVLRAGFWGAVLHVKTVNDMKKYVDEAIEKGEMSHLDFHGVGGDWLVTPTDWFTAFLDKLEERRDELWITDHLSIHKYATTRQGASVETSGYGSDQVRVKLTTTVDTKLYDEPLTLQTKVPAGWRSVQVTQGDRKTTVAAKDGVATYDALANGSEIVLSAAK